MVDISVSNFSNHHRINRSHPFLHCEHVNRSYFRQYWKLLFSYYIVLSFVRTVDWVDIKQDVRMNVFTGFYVTPSLRVTSKQTLSPLSYTTLSFSDSGPIYVILGSDVTLNRIKKYTYSIYI